MRNIDASIYWDNKMLELSLQERYLWIGLILAVADDQGRFECNPTLIKVRIFPLDNDGVKVQSVSDMLSKLVNLKLLHPYSNSNKHLLQIIHWWRYQSCASFMGKSDFPPPKGWKDFWRTGGGKKIDLSPRWEGRKTANDQLIAKWNEGGNETAS